MRALPYLLFMFLGLVAQVSASPSSPTCVVDGVAVGGYDLVSYHQQSAPVQGDEKFAAIHGELTYLFSSSENRETFRADPEKYLPTYQGWCAATLAMGRLACPDYTNFKIENGRLLLFELAGFTNGRSMWNSDPGGFRERADANFTRLVK